MRGGVLLMKTVMEHIKKAVCIVKAYLLNKVLKKIFVFGLDLMTLFATSLKSLFVRIWLTIKQSHVSQTTQELLTTAETTLAKRSLGVSGLLAAIIVLNYLHRVLKVLILGCYNVLVVMKERLNSKG